MSWHVGTLDDPPSTPESPHGGPWLIVGLCLTSLALRLLHLRAVADIVLTIPDEIGLDRWLQMHIGEAVARGDWLGGWSAGYDTGPLYGYWLALPYRACANRWICPVTLQAIFGALGPALAFGIGRELYSRAVGVLAAVLTCLYTPSIFYELLLVKFGLLPVTVAGALFCIARTRRSPTAGWAVLSGATLGTLAALRANGLLVLPVAILWMVGAVRGFGARLRVGLLVCGGALLVLGPVMLRDAVASRRGLGTSLWGIHFYIGANPDADGTYSPVSGIREDVVGHVVDARRIAERVEGRPLTPHEVSMHWYRKGMAFIRRQPIAYARLQVEKLRRTFEADEQGSFGDDFHDHQAISRVLRLPLLTFGVIAPLGILGLLLTLLRGQPALLPLFTLTYVVSLLPFFVTGRYRLPLVPPFLVLAANALCWIEEAMRQHRALTLGAAAAVIALVASQTGPRSQDLVGLTCLLVLGVWMARAVDPEAPSAGIVTGRSRGTDRARG